MHRGEHCVGTIGMRKVKHVFVYTQYAEKTADQRGWITLGL